MSSSHYQSSSTRPSRRIQIIVPLHSYRSTSAPYRPFIIILINNPKLLRQTRTFQAQVQLLTVSNMDPSNISGTPFSSAIAIGNQYFLITITNYPNLFQRTLHYQQPPNQQQRLRGDMLILNVSIHFCIAHTVEHETILHNTLRFELEECQLKSMIYEEEIIEYDIFNDSDYVELIEEEQQDDETILSQKLSQLSTTDQHEINSLITSDKKRRLNFTASPNISSKKMKMTNNDTDEDDNINDNYTIRDQIPKYLSMNNKAFVPMMKNIMKNVQSISMNDIQKLALLMHQVAALRLKREIITIYLQSVTGTLMEPECDLIEADRRVWSMQVQSLMLQKKAKSKTTTEANQNNQQAACEDRLHERLEEINLEIDLSEGELIQKKNSLLEFTSIMNEAIQIYVQEYGIKPLEMKHQLKKAIVMYNYQIEILERKYLHEQPNQYQLPKRLVNMRRNLEKSKRALFELKQGVVFNKSSISFDSIQISMPTLNDTNIKNDKVQQQQQQLLNKYEKQIGCKKLDLLVIHILQAE
ncbi:unnamed protein product [Rotaria sordida]|uniref:Uncharacterized protein n=1 Tax=Rotaria sordida TaxID=392033 RepID=A0A819T1L7_9BILA|nr:unnamed protein product [Rotaria sordida]